MPNSYTQVFGGNTIYPSDVSYLALTLTADITLEWPLEASTGNNVVARILDVTSNGAFSISMPNATQTGVGQTILFNNVAATTFTVKSYTGTTLISIPSGTQWELYLTDNTTTTGTWRAFQFGAATTSAQAAALAGYGLVAQGATLAQSEPVTVFNTSYTFGAADRAGAYVWDGGLGAVTLPAASTAGNNWFVSLRNDGTGNLTLTAAGSDLINGAATLVLRPADSATVVTDGVSFWTIGLGQDPVFAFDYTSISITSQTSPYTLSGAELNRIAYQFVGVLTANMVVYVPATTQQYWVANDTTGGSFTLSIGTSTQASPLTVPRGSRGIYYCDGTSVLKADTASIAVPIAVSDGGTGATTASGARVNLGGTSVGIAVFTAASAAAARTAIGGAADGANSDITSLTGLTTPLSVAQGGSGQSTVDRQHHRKHSYQNVSDGRQRHNNHSRYWFYYHCGYWVWRYGYEHHGGHRPDGRRDHHLRHHRAGLHCSQPVDRQADVYRLDQCLGGKARQRPRDSYDQCHSGDGHHQL